MNTLILVVDELWLKGKNRPAYFKALKDHVKRVVKKIHKADYKLKNEFQRFVLTTSSSFSPEVLEAIALIPGLAKIFISKKVERNKETLIQSLLNEIKEIDTPFKTFKIQSKRIDKTFPEKSMDLIKEIGGEVLKKFSDLKVDLHHPDLLVDIKIFFDSIYFSCKSLPAPGGLPIGTSGHLITLLSGGLDSPVASYMMSKRGCKQTFVFFYAYPFVGDEVKEKIFALAKILGRYQNGSSLFIIPFGNFQKELSKHCREDYRTVFFRYYMIQIANLLAKRMKAQALLTGDSLAQVSSQTIGNISLLDRGSQYPILRPLIGHNKRDIISLSEKIGTYETSIRPYDDACSLFAPKHPVTRPDYNYWTNFVKEQDFSKEMENCLDKSQQYRIDVDGQLDLIESF